MSKYIELEKAMVGPGGYWKDVRWWQPDTWVAQPRTVEITGKVLIPLDDIASVSVEEFTAHVTQKSTRDFITVTKASYELLKRALEVE